ncbi:DoxX family protein [Amycolatopsis mediterranei S699]|uniref:DoxX family protein n=2 Tax=Amycolatopsis mediterranei TaxID=33910 RepID=A0A0H3D1C0_AMYMU|nr:DoxX family protein [Amycolatopsis mediterranei]ADJ43271.1 DoxX family protein [Amycolatopsis mediterranei U32]AEK39972.1 DoxX family protein [Amycolatopsis mediterranei S699]AFO74984.1 DoxX family protein [Amycolatopsis mediterranei S699]AGT82113.1 DoxX family protein [Amycolatopsis mediterranei RB]KDO11140.1 membrane protein [Amycolatopsis mediterranei]
MNIVLWIIAGLLAAAFAAAGAMKLTQPKEKLAASGMAWTEDVSPGLVKLIGGLEVLAAIGLILPAVLDIAPVLVPFAALGLVLIMIGAIVTHARRKETQAIGINVVLLLLAAVVVWGRFGPYSFGS